MAFDPVEKLRAAGILGDSLPAEQQEYFRNLSEQETSLLISLKDRIPGFLPEVMAHSWNTPEALQAPQTASMECACGAWSGSGSGSQKPTA